MLHTIEVEIDANGDVQPLEPVEKLPAGRALLTLLSATPKPDAADRSTDLQSLTNLFGILKAERSATLDEMRTAVQQRAAERFHLHDRD